MKKYIAKRLLLLIPIMLGASLLSFSILYLAPGDPAELMLERQLQGAPTQEQIDAFKEKHGLNAPVPIQFGGWLYKISHGDLGTSLRTEEPVLKEFLNRFPASLVLFFLSQIISIAIGIPLGIISAVKHNSKVDHFSRLIAMFGVSMPNFWLGLLLILFFAVYLDLFPAFGYGEISHIILPAVALGVSGCASIMRLMRASMLEVLNLDYIRTARAKGLCEQVVIVKHGLKNALIPVVTFIGFHIGHLFSGMVIIETVFAWPGVGRFLIQSIHSRDFPVIQGFVLIIAMFCVFAILIVDILYTYLDPRIRYE
ncbi:MAG: ABC transporter permease [Methanosarcinales archaeon]|nr:ABC transporter permease [Methanosarcinales archaeon]